MKLILEKKTQTRIEESEYGDLRYLNKYIKKYKDGLLVYELEDYDGDRFEDPSSKTRNIEYDSNARIIKEVISEKEGSEPLTTDTIHEIVYEYNNESYRKTTKLMLKGTIDTDATYSNQNSEKKIKFWYKKLDQIESILEVKYINERKISEKYVSFFDNTNRFTNYIYGYDKKGNRFDVDDYGGPYMSIDGIENTILYKIEGYHVVDGRECFKSDFKYEEGKGRIEEIHYDKDGIINLQKKYKEELLIEELRSIGRDYFENDGYPNYLKIIYKNGQIKERIYLAAKEYENNNNFKGVTTKEVYEYDADGNLIKTEYYTIFNKKELIYKRELISYVIIENRPEAANRKFLEKEFVTETSSLSIKEFDETHDLQTGEIFILTSKVEKEYDSKGRLMELKKYDINTLKERTTYNFDKKGCFTEIAYYDFDLDNNIPVYSDNEINEYDLNGNLVMKIKLRISTNKISWQEISHFYYEIN